MLWSRMKYDIRDFFKKEEGVWNFWGNTTGSANTVLRAEMIKKQNGWMSHFLNV